MPDTLTVACPECGKQIKAPAEVAGKKIRCKGCGEIFVATAAPARAAAPPAKPAKPAKPAADDDDDDMGDGKPYDITALDTAPRCPECANEMEGPEAVICLKCGYNTRTRSRVVTRKLYHHTPFDYFLWLLPGILCALAVIGLIVWDVLYLIYSEDWFKDSGWLWWIASGGIRLWVVVITLFLMFFAGKYAIKRLILHPKPPEIELKA